MIMATGRRADERVLRVLISGGGTGGHVYPGLAVAAALRELEPGLEVRWAGTRRGIESLLVPRAGYRFKTLPAAGFRGLGAAARLRFVGLFGAGVLVALGFLLRWRPDVILGTGGYASAPVLVAARLCGLTIALQEQNAVPGTANRLAARWARRIYLGVAAARTHFPEDRTVVTGNPVRLEFTRADAGNDAARPVEGGAGPPVSAGKLKVLVFGGSRGARTLNRAVCALAEAWRGSGGPALWLQTGRDDFEEVSTAYSASAASVSVVPYIDAMPAALAWADLVICRAGAMTLAELQVAGRPAILVPYPHAVDDHQLRNAEDVAAAGAALVVRDDACSGERLRALVAELDADRPRLAKMAAAAARLAQPEAAETIARDLVALARSEAGSGGSDVP
jgi:UDP-N-acetylglucosamine--N-acetylmuramyl-(pentapeptide) pyrophosphoryl-undecaprenol N-acetylglucosamine transferase